MNEKSARYPLVPEEERKCIWMTTGFISYKLCDRNHQCETCPLEQAIKNEKSREDAFPEQEDDWTEGTPNGDPSIRISGSIFYHPGHCWVKVETPERVRVGIDDLLIQLISQIEVVVLPRAGSPTHEGESCAHIIQSDYILPVVSPLSGSVQAVNSRLLREPQLVTDDPKGDGWLISVKPNNLESDLKKLLFGRNARSWYRQEEKKLLARGDQILRDNTETVGTTMQDGGVRISRLQDLLNVISPGQKAQILDSSIGCPRKKI